jgi:hypothetical protein
VAGSVRKVLDLFAGFNIHLSCILFVIKEIKPADAARFEILRSKFKAEEKSGKILFETLVMTGEKQKALNVAVESRSTDLIAFQPHKHGIMFNLFARKITRKNLQATNIPLLAIPTFEEKN